MILYIFSGRIAASGSRTFGINSGISGGFNVLWYDCIKIYEMRS